MNRNKKKWSVSLVAIVGMLAISMCVVGAELMVGSVAPEFECKGDDGKVWKSSDHYGQKIVVVYFYPAAMTGGCTKQACAFRDDKEELTKKGVEVVAVSGDEVEGLQLFKKVNNLNFTLLADTDGAVAKKFGVPVQAGGTIEREVDGKVHKLTTGVRAARWTFVIDKSGKIAHKETKVDAPGDSKAVLAVAEKLAAK